MIRQPIISVLGHTDAGKTSLLDEIRSSRVTGQEQGGITQMIGATEIPLETVNNISGELLQAKGIELDIPGLLFIDTPGHAAFSSLRKRGGSLSDLAILVVDINQGIQPQTEEAINILKEDQTPFVIALNKVDTIKGWKSDQKSFIKNLKENNSSLEEEIDERLYELMGEFNEHDIVVDRFDRIDNFKKKVAVTPISAETGEGIPEMLMVLSGLAQRYLEEELKVSEGSGKASVLEVSKEEGLGKTIDVIHYDGKLKKGQKLLYGDKNGEVKSTKIRSLLKTKEKTEIRREKEFIEAEESEPASGVRINAQDLEGVYPGSPVRSGGDLEKAEEEINKEIEGLQVDTDQNGIIVKADSLGTLEAVREELREKQIPVKKAEVGNITKADVLEAQNHKEINRAVVGFNTDSTELAKKEAEESGIRLMTSRVIFNLTDSLSEWRDKKQKEKREKKLEQTFRPAKIRVLNDHVFRSSNPVVCGVEVLEGVLSARGSLMDRNGNPVGKIKSVQKENEKVEKARKGDEVAVSVDDATLDRDFCEGDVLFTNLSGDDYNRLKSLEDLIGSSEEKALEKIVEIKDSKDPHWKL